MNHTQQIQLRADLFVRIETHVGMVEGLQGQLNDLKWALAHDDPHYAGELLDNIINMAEAHRLNLVATGTEIRNKLPGIPGRT